MNARSSRSHTVFQLAISAARAALVPGGKAQALHGSLNLVDLAGSERLDRSGATGDRLKETQVCVCVCVCVLYMQTGARSLHSALHRDLE